MVRGNKKGEILKLDGAPLKSERTDQGGLEALVSSFKV
jgi:hypothetical protein